MNAPVAHDRPSEAPNVVVAAWQTVARSNGGLESLSSLLEACDFAPSVVITNRWSPFAERWARLAPVELRPMVGRAERSRSRLVTLPNDILSLLRNNLWMARRLARLGNPILHCNDEVALLNFGIGARLAGCPVLFHVRDTRTERNLYRVVRWRLFLALSTRFVTLSREMCAWWLAYLSISGRTPLGASKLRHLYSVVSQPYDVQMNVSVGARSEKPLVVGVIGVFSPKKAQLELIENCCRPLAQSNVEFFFYGDTEAYPEYTQACRQKAGDMLERSIHFMGHVERSYLVYQELDVVIVASRHEGLARAMIEALAAGVPVVSFAVCSAREVLEDHGAGIVVPSGDYAALVRTLREIESDRSRLAAMSAKARVVAAAHFAPDAAAAKYRNLLGELRYVAGTKQRHQKHLRTLAADLDLGDLRVRDHL